MTTTHFQRCRSPTISGYSPETLEGVEARVRQWEQSALGRLHAAVSAQNLQPERWLDGGRLPDAPSARWHVLKSLAAQGVAFLSRQVHFVFFPSHGVRGAAR